MKGSRKPTQFNSTPKDNILQLTTTEKIVHMEISGQKELSGINYIILWTTDISEIQSGQQKHTQEQIFIRTM